MVIKMRLADLQKNKSGIIADIMPCENRLRLMEMGIVKGTQVFLVHRAPFSGPIEIALRGYKLTLRKSDAERIIINPQ